MNEIALIVYISSIWSPVLDAAGPFFSFDWNLQLILVSIFIFLLLVCFTCFIFSISAFNVAIS